MPIDLTGLSDIFGGGKDLIPHIEERALRYSIYRYVMPSRVTALSDMAGFNVRKVSNYLRVRRAQELQEATDIPKSKVLRRRLTEINVKEYGDMYPITDRRTDTDLENIVADTISFLGAAIGDRRERDLIDAAILGVTGGNVGSATSHYDWRTALNVGYEFQHKHQIQWDGQLFHVIHPFQARRVMRELVDFTLPADLMLRNSAVASWNIPAMPGMNIAVSHFIPRKVTYILDVSGIADDATFRLEFATQRQVDASITDAITKSGTAATTATNVATELNALTYVPEGQTGSWTAVADAVLGNARIIVTSPFFLDAHEELRSAENPDTGDLYVNGDEVIIREKTAVARAPLFARNAIVWDVRQAVRAYVEEQNQGRTTEWSAYEKAGIGAWVADHGYTIESLCLSSVAEDYDPSDEFGS